jgi:O-antigen ligase
LLLGAHFSHVSRFPQVVALIFLGILSTFLISRKKIQFGRWALALPIGIGAVVLLGGRTGEIAQRWQLVGAPAAKTTRAIPAESEWPHLVRDDLLIPNVYNSRAWGDRSEAQRTATHAISARPLTGHGPGNWAAAASHFSSDPYLRSFYLYLQFSHEDFLQRWTEWGLGGFISLILLLPGAVVAGYRAISIKDPLIATLTFSATLGLAAVLLQSLLDFPLQIPAVALNASVLAGLAWSAVYHSRTSTFSPAT